MRSHCGQNLIVKVQRWTDRFPMATDCLACINTRIGTGFQCCLCGAGTATCSVSEEFAGGTSFVIILLFYGLIDLLVLCA